MPCIKEMIMMMIIIIIIICYYDDLMKRSVRVCDAEREFVNFSSQEKKGVFL